MMTDDEYTNLDLETAENLLIAAGSPEQAKAMRRYTEGVRNLVQGEFGMSFVKALERIITPLTEEIHGLRGDVQQSAAESAARLGKLEEGQERLAGEVADLAGRTTASEADRKDIHERLERVEAVDAELARLRDEVASVKKIIVDRPAQREAEYRKIAERAADEAIKRLEAREGGH